MFTMYPLSRERSKSPSCVVHVRRPRLSTSTHSTTRDGARARRRRVDDDVGGVGDVGDVRVGAARAGCAWERGRERAWWISTIRRHPGRENDDDAEDDAEDGANGDADDGT
jgi:hypothetical protein